MTDNTTLTAAAVTALAYDLVAALEAAQAALDALDAQGGDADHGTTMVLAARAARDAADPVPPTAADAFAAIGGGFASVGGSVGPLWGAGWYALSELAHMSPGPDLRAAGIEAVAAAVSSLGGATPGDGTMIDALGPAAVAAGALDAPDDDVVGAAAAGAATTAGRPARIGRASRATTVRPGEDPGAASAVIVLRHLVPLLSSGNSSSSR